MATKSRYEAYAKGIIAKRDSKIAKGSSTKTSVLAQLKEKKEQKPKSVPVFQEQVNEYQWYQTSTGIL